MTVSRNFTRTRSTGSFWLRLCENGPAQITFRRRRPKGPFQATISISAPELPSILHPIASAHAPFESFISSEGGRA